MSLLSGIACLAAAALPAAQDPGLRHAPPPLEVDGLTGVPIDITALSGTLMFDAGAREARATARMTFRMSAEGMPLFDLRQEVEAATLDGEAVDPADLALHEVSDAAGSLRILESGLEAGSEHVLELEYPVTRPLAPETVPIGWGDGSLTWDTWFSDLNPGRYLELWFPANLLYDSFPFELELELRGAAAAHHMITNAAVEELGEHHWRLRFPATYTACSPMIVIVPAADVEYGERTVTLPDGQEVHVEVFRRHEAAENTGMKRILDQVERDLAGFTEAVGPWAHGGHCPVYLWRSNRSMEYDGATTTALGALRHELFHSWWGRGVKPASGSDGWWDEAWNMYASPFSGRPPQDPGEELDPVTLCADDPYNRMTPGRFAYSLGATFFARLATVIGEEELHELMDSFYAKHAPGVASTGELEEHIVSQVEAKEEVRRLFHRYVYGRAGEAPREGQ